jgi:hypothetical protein
MYHLGSTAFGLQPSAFEPQLVHAVGLISILGTPRGLNQGPNKGLSGPVLKKTFDIRHSTFRRVRHSVVRHSRPILAFNIWSFDIRSFDIQSSIRSYTLLCISSWVATTKLIRFRLKPCIPSTHRSNCTVLIFNTVGYMRTLIWK